MVKRGRKFWGDSGEEDNDDDNEETDDGDDDDGNDDDGDSYDNDDDSDDKRMESHRDEIPDPNQTNIHEEENINDEEKLDEEEDDEITKELYKDINVSLGNKDAEMTDAEQGGADQQNVSQESVYGQVEEDAYMTLTTVHDTQKTDGATQSSSVSSDFISKLLILDNPSPTDIDIASLMDTTIRHEETSSQTSSLYSVPITTIPEVTTTISPPPPFFNPLQQQATPTQTPTTSEATTSFFVLPDFSSVFKFNDRVTKLETDLSEMKEVDKYAQALSSIPAIVDRYIDEKLREAIQKAIKAHNFDYREEAQAEKREYIELVDTTVRAVIKQEVSTQLPQILPQAVSDVATPVIEKNVTESLEATVLAKSSSQPTSSYEAAASLSDFELTKILIDKMKKNKSFNKGDYKRELYDALVKSYQMDKDLFDSYGEVFSLKRSRDDGDKDQDPSTGSDRGTKRRKSSKDVESSRDSRSKEKKSLSTSKDTSHSQLKSSSNQVARAEEPPTSFDELLNTPIDFSAFVLNRLNIKDITQEILVGPAFELLKGTYKSLIELEYHLEECSKATTERLEWHNPEGKSYPFDLSKPLRLIQDRRGRQVIPQDYFINNDLEYLKGGDLLGLKDFMMILKLLLLSTASVYLVYKLLLLMLEVNVASTKVTTAQRLRLLKEFLLSKKG
ncbi:hypothetical protein Tco_0493961 [Tanacetum coccineum]